MARALRPRRPTLSLPPPLAGATLPEIDPARPPGAPAPAAPAPAGTTTPRRVCAWCGAAISSGARRISHGICAACLAQLDP